MFRFHQLKAANLLKSPLLPYTLLPRTLVGICCCTSHCPKFFCSEPQSQISTRPLTLSGIHSSTNIAKCLAIISPASNFALTFKTFPRFYAVIGISCHTSLQKSTSETPSSHKLPTQFICSVHNDTKLQFHICHLYN